MGEVMPLTPEDVSNKRFTPVRLREGYDMGEVDQFLDEVEAELARLTKENDDLRSKLSAAQSGTPAATTAAIPVQKAPEPEPQPEPEPEPEPEPSAAALELERLETLRAELREAERLFARTRAELAARSDALAEREAALAAGERELAARRPAPPAELEALEARIRRLEHGPRSHGSTTQTFSGGLKALQERGLRRPAGDEPLH